MFVSHFFLFLQSTARNPAAPPQNYVSHCTSQVVATIYRRYLSPPSLFAAALTFVFLSSKVVRSMALANLFPKALSHTYGDEKIPYAALAATSSIGFLLSCLCYYVPQMAKNSYNLGMLASYLSYISQCYGFFVFRSVSPSLLPPSTSCIRVRRCVYVCCSSVCVVLASSE